jgi:hypothetical protein
VHLLVRRFTAVDCEKATTDESILESRQSELKEVLLQYQVFGKFRRVEGGACFPDTYFFTLRELKEVRPSSLPPPSPNAFPLPPFLPSPPPHLPFPCPTPRASISTHVAVCARA